MIVLSHYQAEALIQEKGKGSFTKVSPDLGLSKVKVHLDEGVRFPDGERISWDVIAEIADNENNCFIFDHGDMVSIQKYSESFSRVYTLYPTESAPTMLVSGIPMHRIKGIDPWEDTKNKMKAFGRLGGHILDTATGLGYTAILAAEHANQVTTIEIDPAAQEIARQNPWSLPLFEHSKITQMIGDSGEVIETFDEQVFSGIIHDPPMFSLAGSLYALAFYQQAYRVLKPNGRMFHYIGNPKSKSGGRVTRGVTQRLKQAGFSRMEDNPRSFGVVAFK
jgi:predicted methyltransferase